MDEKEVVVTLCKCELCEFLRVISEKRLEELRKREWEEKFGGERESKY